jgi:hypothetical protein
MKASPGDPVSPRANIRSYRPSQSFPAFLRLRAYSSLFYATARITSALKRGTSEGVTTLRELPAKFGFAFVL